MTLPERQPLTEPVPVDPAAKDWQEANDAWLSAAVAHLRLSLQALAAEGTRVVEAPRGANRWRAVFRGGGNRAEAPEPVAAPSRAEIDRAAHMRADAEEAMSPGPALHILGDRLDLTPFEREVLLLCAAVELDTRIATSPSGWE